MESRIATPRAGRLEAVRRRPGRRDPAATSYHVRLLAPEPAACTRQCIGTQTNSPTLNSDARPIDVSVPSTLNTWKLRCAAWSDLLVATLHHCTATVHHAHTHIAHLLARVRTAGLRHSSCDPRSAPSATSSSTRIEGTCSRAGSPVCASPLQCSQCADAPSPLSSTARASRCLAGRSWLPHCHTAAATAHLVATL